MNLNEVISAFKEFLRSDPRNLNEDDHEIFRSAFAKAPKSVLMQVRILVEQMKSRIDQNQYQTYYHFINSLINSQGSLHGRISPDILEPITDMSLINPVRNYSSNEVIEITTGTSIWALFLKRQLLEQNRMDQRQIKSLIQIKFILMKKLKNLKNFAFVSIFASKTRKNLESFLISCIDRPFSRYLRECFGVLKKHQKKIEKIQTALKNYLKLMNRKVSICEKHLLDKRFKVWKSKLSFGFSYFSFSPIKGEKEIDFETEEKLAEANYILIEKSGLLTKSVLRNFEKIARRVRAGGFLQIMKTCRIVEFESEARKLDELCIEERKSSSLKRIMIRSYCTLTGSIFSKFQKSAEHSKWKEKRLRSVIKHLKLGLLKVFNKFRQHTQSKTVQSNQLESVISRLSHKKMRKNLSSLLTFPSFLLKKGFEAFVFNYYDRNLETINQTWQWKISSSNTKWQKLLSNSQKSAKTSSNFLKLLNSYLQSLKTHTFRLLKSSENPKP